MKKFLLSALLALVTCITFANTTFTNAPIAAWDKPLAKHIVINPLVKPLTDPYVTNYGAYVIGTFNAPNYAVNIQITFNQTVGVPYYAIVQVLGDWNFDGANNGASYREFTILFSGAQHYKSVNFPMAPSEEAYTTVMDLLDYGPQ